MNSLHWFVIFGWSCSSKHKFFMYKDSTMLKCTFACRMASMDVSALSNSLTASPCICGTYRSSAKCILSLQPGFQWHVGLARPLMTTFHLHADDHQGANCETYQHGCDGGMSGHPPSLACGSKGTSLWQIQPRLKPHSNSCLLQLQCVGCRYARAVRLLGSSLTEYTGIGQFHEKSFSQLPRYSCAC